MSEVVQQTTQNNNVSAQVAPNGVPVFGSDWTKLGVETGYNPPAAEDLRFYFIGPSGEGKTTFISSIPDTLILDFERGARGVVGGKAARVVIKNYEHYEEVITKLVEAGKTGRAPFKRICIDTTDEWQGLIGLQLAKEKDTEDITEFGSKGHGWALMRNRCWQAIRSLENAGYAWTCVGHLTEKNVTDPVTKKEVTVIRPLLFDSFSKQILRQADIFGTIYNLTEHVPNKVKINVQGVVREIDKGTREVVRHYLDMANTNTKGGGKKRCVPTLVGKIELPIKDGWDRFKKEYDTAVSRAKQGQTKPPVTESK